MIHARPLLDIETYEGIAITLNLDTGQFQAEIPRGCLHLDKLITMRSFIRQAMLIERALASRDEQEALHD